MRVLYDSFTLSSDTNAQSCGMVLTEKEELPAFFVQSTEWLRTYQPGGGV